MNEDFLDKVSRIKDELTEQFGEFGLFALIERSELPNRWDVVVAGSWIQRDDYALLAVIVGIFRQHLNDDEMMFLSGVVLMDPADRLVQEITHAIGTKGGTTEVRSCAFNGLEISHLYALVSNGAAFTLTGKRSHKKYEAHSSLYEAKKALESSSSMATLVKH